MTSTDPIPPGGPVYQEMVAGLLAAEFDRRKTLESRGATLVTASGTMLTLIFGLTVVVTGKDHVFSNHLAVLVLFGALAAFVASAVIAIFVQTYAFKYTVPSRETLKRIVRDDTEWQRGTNFVTRAWVSKQVNTICSLRDGNDRKAQLVMGSLACQVAAIALLSASVGLELYSRLQEPPPQPAHAVSSCAPPVCPCPSTPVLPTTDPPTVNGKG